MAKVELFNKSWVTVSTKTRRILQEAPAKEGSSETVAAAIGEEIMEAMIAEEEDRDQTLMTQEILAPLTTSIEEAREIEGVLTTIPSLKRRHRIDRGQEAISESACILN